MSLKRGILIIGVGHINYTLMAANLAASIKVNDPALPVAFACGTPPPSWMHEKGLFDMIIHVPEEYYTGPTKNEFIKVKLHMYDLSPFNETIFLDADQILINSRKLLPVFDELDGIDVTFSNTGVAGSSIWADMNEVKKLYGDKPYWNYHSEFVYFKKGKVAKKYFDAAKKVYKDNKINSANRFAGSSMADELAFQVAAMITDTYPHKPNWLPNFWYDRHRELSRKYPYQLTEKITYSIGGIRVPDNVKVNYNNLAKHYFATLGLSNPWQVVDKKNYLPERQLV